MAHYLKKPHAFQALALFPEIERMRAMYEGDKMQRTQQTGDTMHNVEMFRYRMRVVNANGSTFVSDPSQELPRDAFGEAEVLHAVQAQYDGTGTVKAENAATGEMMFGMFKGRIYTATSLRKAIRFGELSGNPFAL